MRYITCGLIGALLAGSFALPAAADSAVKIKNRSNWAIHELYISSVDDDEWGPDQLGKDVIESGDSFMLTGIPCDAYDVRLVDEDGDECVVGGVALCESDVWTITDRDLLRCQALTD